MVLILALQDLQSCSFLLGRWWRHMSEVPVQMTPTCLYTYNRPQTRSLYVAGRGGVLPPHGTTEGHCCGHGRWHPCLLRLRPIASAKFLTVVTYERVY
jgi:hypothetical protein